MSDRIGGDVGKHQGHPVSLSNSHGGQRIGEAVHTVAQFPVANLGSEKEGGYTLGIFVDRVLEELIDRLVMIGDGPGNLLIIRLVPDLFHHSQPFPELTFL